LNALNTALAVAKPAPF